MLRGGSMGEPPFFWWATSPPRVMTASESSISVGRMTRAVIGLAFRRRRDHFVVGMALGDLPGVQKDVQGRLEGRPGDLDMGRPVAELLIGRDGGGEDLPVDLGKEGLLDSGDLLRRSGGVDPRRLPDPRWC